MLIMIFWSSRLSYHRTNSLLSPSITLFCRLAVLRCAVASARATAGVAGAESLTYT